MRSGEMSRGLAGYLAGYGWPIAVVSRRAENVADEVSCQQRDPSHVTV